MHTGQLPPERLAEHLQPLLLSAWGLISPIMPRSVLKAAVSTTLLSAFA